MSAKACTAFILVNDAIPDFSRLETTTKDDLVARIGRLNRTELPVPFRLFYAASVGDGELLVRNIRFLFADRWEGGESGFFKVAPELLRAVIEPAATAVLEYSDEDLGVSPAQRAQMTSIRDYHDTLRFRALNVEPGTILQFALDPSVTCTVIGNGLVEFEEVIATPAEASLKAMHKLGFDWNEVSAIDYWTAASSDRLSADHFQAGVSIMDSALAAKKAAEEAADASPIMFVRNNKI